MASPDASGPSGGVPGNSRGLVSRDLCEKYPGLARQIVTAGQHPRAGHDRRRWETVSWDDYRAKVAVGQSRGWWRIEPSVSRPGDLAWWSARGQQMPVTPPGLYASLVHQDRGLVMSDLPAEIAGALPFLDYAAGQLRPVQVLIAGLGLGIVPAWLLAHASVARIDIIEIDADVIALITRGCRERGRRTGGRRIRGCTSTTATPAPGGPARLIAAAARCMATASCTPMPPGTRRSSTSGMASRRSTCRRCTGSPGGMPGASA